MQEHPYRYYYKPQNAAAADFIPFWYDGKFRLFYLHDWRDADNYGTGVPWYLIETEDLLHFDEKGEVIPRGTPEEPDNFIFTGSIIRADDQFHIFYTAHNHRMIDKGLPQELITHAVSNDLIHWKKLSEESFPTTPDCDPHNFRDPFVFFDEDLGMYRMACVKRREGSSYISGITGQYVSRDLKNWEPAEDLWTPELFNTHECPDIFKIGDWWYLIYSEYSDRNMTRYVMSRSLNGPWIMPEDDFLEGRAYYAAKSWSDGQHRYLFGWIPTRNQDREDSHWEWGGNLSVLELVQRADGTLSCRMPQSLVQAWTPVQQVETTDIRGDYCRADKLFFSNLPDTYRVDATLRFTPGTKNFGITMGQDFPSRHGYKYEFTPFRNQVRFGQVSRIINSVDLDRPINLDPEKPVHIRLVVDYDICTLFVNDEIALSSRMCEIKGKDLAFFAIQGGIQVENATLYTL